MSNNVVPGTAAPAGVDPASLIPASHIPGALDKIAQAGANPGMLNILRSMQAQIDAMMNGVAAQEMPDVVVVNPGGRLVEITGESSVEYLAKPGFRKATPEEEANYRKAMLRQTPEYLRRMEKKRLQDEAAMYDELERDDTISGKSNEDLLRATVTEAQKTGAMEPGTLPAQTPVQTPENTPPATNDTPEPPKRGKAAKSGEVKES